MKSEKALEVALFMLDASEPDSSQGYQVHKVGNHATLQRGNQAVSPIGLSKNKLAKWITRNKGKLKNQ